MSGIKCVGTEKSLDLCPRSTAAACNTSKAAGVICSNASLPTTVKTTS
jgi:hypothetical protein